MIKKILKRGVLGTIIPLAGNRLAIYLYRFSHFLHRCYIPELPYLFQYLNAIINGCEIHYKAKIGKKFRISHSRGVVIGSQTVIGNNVTIHSGVVFGKKDKNSGMPVIKDDVFIGAGAIILGDITIGTHSIIGANAVVNKSFESNVLIAGIPARIVKKIKND